MSDPKHPHIAEAIRVIGSQAELAKRVGYAQQSISRMLILQQPVPAELAKRIDEVTAGEVPRWKLRPDLWDAPADAPTPVREGAAA